MEFFLSPGFGGAAAVAAAVIAYAAARWRGKIDRELGRRSEWWSRTQWALDRTQDEDRFSQLLGWRALSTLADSAPTAEDAALIAQAAEAAQIAYGAEAESPGRPREETAGDVNEGDHELGTAGPQGS